MLRTKYLLGISSFAFLVGMSGQSYAADQAVAKKSVKVEKKAEQPVQKPAMSFYDALTESKLYLDSRYRYESVHQDGVANDAHANTVRTIVGVESAEYKGFKVNLAALGLFRIGGNNYNDGENGKTTYPRIGDPNDLQLHLANFTYSGIPDVKATFGRQYLSFDNQRFIGAPRWRQIPQSFDGAVVTYTPVKPVELTYGFLFHANRSPGANVVGGTYDMHTHVMHATYSGIENVKLNAYGYLVDIRGGTTATTGLSSATFGIRPEGKYPIIKDFYGQSLFLTAAADYANQSGYANNPNTYTLNYYNFEPGVAWGDYSLKYIDESLGGNGRVAMQTPLASSHSMNGWADQFQTIPVDGLRDQYFAFSAKRKLIPGLGAAKFDAQWHSYSAKHVSMHYGNELGLNVEQPFMDHYSVGVKYMDYNANNLLRDTQKIVLSFQVKF